MAGLGWNIADAFVDNGADRFVNNFIPGNGMFVFSSIYYDFPGLLRCSANRCRSMAQQ